MYEAFLSIIPGLIGLAVGGLILAFSREARFSLLPLAWTAIAAALPIVFLIKWLVPAS